MSAFSLSGTPLDEQVSFGVKKVVAVITGTASYDTNGSTLDLSAAFPSKVYGINVLSVSAHGSAKYKLTFTPGASYAPASGKIKVIDTTTDPGAEVSSTADLSTVSWVLEIVGK